MPATVGHSHRSTTKVAHKSFKARKSSKGALKEIMKGMIFGTTPPNNKY